MFRIIKPVTAAFNGGTISFDYMAFLSQRGATKTQSIDETFTTPVSPSYVKQMLLEYLGWYPPDYAKYFVTNDTATWADLPQSIRYIITAFGFDFDYIAHSTGTTGFGTAYTSDNKTIGYYNSSGTPAGTIRSGGLYVNGIGASTGTITITKATNGSHRIVMNFPIIPETAYDHGVLDPQTAGSGKNIHVEISLNDHEDPSKVHRVEITPGNYTRGQYLISDLAASTTDDLQVDTVNPYNPHEPAGPGGGDGDPNLDPNAPNPLNEPDLPDIGAVDAGFITMYNPSKAQLKSLANFLWSSAFDIDSFKKLFADPMQCIIGLGIIPVQPTLAGSKSVTFGDVDSGVSMPYLSNQFVIKQMGSVTIKKYIGCFLDYSATQIQIYLPYIGIRDLSPYDVMGDTVSVSYHIDCLTGGCAAIISTAKHGIMYQFNGNCIANIPLTAINYSGAIQNAVSAVGSLATTIVGAATGAAPVAAMGAASLAATAANTAVNSKPVFQRSGTMGGAAGLLSIQTPYVIINRPRLAVPANLNTYTGNTIYMEMKLSKCKGFTQVEQIKLESVSCMANERNELYSLLKEGVIF